MQDTSLAFSIFNTRHIQAILPDKPKVLTAACLMSRLGKWLEGKRCAGYQELLLHELVEDIRDMILSIDNRQKNK